MTVDSSPMNAARPREAALSIHSFFSGATGDYEVLRVLSSHMATATLCVRHQVTGELAELRFVLNPAYSIANLTSAGTISTALPAETAAAQTSTQAQGDTEAMRGWRQNTAAWTRALRPLLTMGAHPHIQRLLDFGEVEMGFYVLLENVEGRTLRQVLEAEGARSLEWTLPLCVQIAAALDFAAAQKLSHGDLTPDNIILSEAPLPDTPSSNSPANASANPSGIPPHALRTETFAAVRLRSFGLTCLPPRIISAYTSPEQAAGQEGDPRSDIYALGAVLYACLSGRPPFTAISRDELCQKILNTSPLPLAGQPAWARDIVARAKQRTRAERYQVAMDIVTDLTFQRSPAQFVLDAHQQDCTLGHFMPALALREDAPDSARTEDNQEKKGRKRKGKSPADTDDTLEILVGTGRLARMLTALRSPLAFLRRPTAEPSADPGATLEDAPIHGFLGYFNRYMALQDYVRLDPNDLEWQGWRGRLRTVGIRLPARLPRKTSSHSLWLREFRLELPARLARWLKSFKRAALIAIPLTLLALCLHAAQRVQQHGRAWAFYIEGRPTVTRAGKKPVLLQPEDILDAADPPTISTDASHPLTLALADSSITLAPGSVLRITQMSYNGARQRRMELLKGAVDIDIAPEAENDPERKLGYYDLLGGDIQVRPNSTETPTTLSLSLQTGGAVVCVARGHATVSAHGRKKDVGAGKKLAAETDKPLENPSDIPLENSRKLLADAGVQADAGSQVTVGIQPGAPASLLTHWVCLYTESQQKTVMPVVDQAMTLFKLKPGAQNAVDEIQARVALNAIHLALQAAGELPASLDYDTLQEIGPDENARKRWLNPFADHKLIACHLENGAYTLLARVNNQDRTLLKWQSGEITAVPPQQEDEEIKKAEAK